MLEALRQDLRFAFRHLARSPGFAAAAMLTLAFGVGANTAMFTILNALVLRPLAIKDPNGLIGVSGRSLQNPNQLRLTPIPAINELAREGGVLQDVCGYNGGVILPVEVDGVATQVVGALITGRCLTTFGVAPILGRPIVEADAPLGSAGNRVALIGHRFWKRMFGSDPNAVGRTIRLEGVDLLIVGVLPEGFEGLHADVGVDVFMPFDTVFASRTDRRPAASHILGRLKPRVTLEQATAELIARWPAILEVVVPATMPPSERAALRDAQPRVERIGTGTSYLRDRYASPLTIISGLTMTLLLLACVNLGGLLLSRLASRGSELAIRQALGGSRWRIAQQMLVENLLLSVTGAALAIPMSFAIIGPLGSFVPAGLVPANVRMTPDLQVLMLTVIAGVIAGILMSLLPIWIAQRQHQRAMLFSWDRTIAGSTSRWAKGLLVAQIAISVVLLVGAGLLTRSLHLLQHSQVGVHTDGVVIVRVMQLPSAYRTIDNASYYPTLLEKLGALPGIRSVGIARLFPRVSGEPPLQSIGFVGDEPGNARAVYETASPGFFETVGIPLLAGRLLTWADNATTQQVGVVSEAASRALSSDGNVIGRRVRFGSDRAQQSVVIVGIVGNATLGNRRQSNVPAFYRPTLQAGLYANYPSLALATNGDMQTVAAGVRQVLKEGGREYAHEIASLDDILEQSPSGERMSATLASAVAALAVVLAFIGVFGLLAYAVSRRTREIGLRVAVGADPGAVLRMILREGFMLALTGVAIGWPVAVLASRTLRTLMFGVSESDPLTFVATAVFFLVLGLAAGIVPARRASGVDPMIALRAE